MAESFFPFDAGPGAAVLEGEWQRMGRAWLGTGVINDFRNELAVTPAAAGLAVAVASGGAWVEGFWYDSDTAFDRALATADATNPRIDTVVVRLDRTANSMSVAVVTGAAAVAPVRPALSATDFLWEMPLVDVRVNATVTTVTAANITDRRDYAATRHRSRDLTPMFLFGVQP